MILSVPRFRIVLSFASLAVAFFGISAFSGKTALANANTWPDSLVLNAGGYTETVLHDKITSWLRLETRLVNDPHQTSEIEDTHFCPAQSGYCAFSLSRASRSHLKVRLESDVNETAVEDFVAQLAGKADRDPVNAVFSVNDAGNVIIAEREKTGHTVKKDESLSLILRVLRSGNGSRANVNLPTDSTEPKIVASDRERLGLKELVGEGRTNFKGSPKNRIYNINRALRQFESVLIAPDEEFSFVDRLGEVDGEHGYLPELVIKNNRTEPEFGGGICQVSSTVFRAAIYSGMKITARRNHAYPVQYYRPYGMDATIYIPKPDLRFVNNTSGHILMQPIVNGTELIFRFYGTKDGRSVSVDGPHILQSNPDGSMKTVFSQLVTDADGNSVINDSFWSNYKSPSLFPHPGDEILKEKPADWPVKQWQEYQKTHSH